MSSNHPLYNKDKSKEDIYRERIHSKDKNYNPETDPYKVLSDAKRDVSKVHEEKVNPSYILTEEEL